MGTPGAEGGAGRARRSRDEGGQRGGRAAGGGCRRHPSAQRSGPTLCTRKTPTSSFPLEKGGWAGRQGSAHLLGDPRPLGKHSRPTFLSVSLRYLGREGRGRRAGKGALTLRAGSPRSGPLHERRGEALGEAAGRLGARPRLPGLPARGPRGVCLQRLLPGPRPPRKQPPPSAPKAFVFLGKGDGVGCTDHFCAQKWILVSRSLAQVIITTIM